MKRCPECGNKTFIISPHVVQDWKVDEHGNYIETLCDYVEMVHDPDDDDIWVCAECGYEGAGSEFNIKEE